MANWSGIILTDRGRALQAKVETGVSLNITKFKLGDGIASGALESLLDLVHPLQTVGIGSVKALGGMCEITGVLTNSSVTTGYYLRELGIYAMDPDLGEILYAITTDSAPDYLPPGGGNVVISEEFSINIAISNATNVTAILNPQGLVTTTIMQSAISNHNNDENAHPGLKTLVLNSGINLWTAKKSYSIGDIAYSKNLPSWARLECVKSGTTGDEEPDWTNVQSGGVIRSDGTILWIIDDVRDCLPVGVVASRLYLPAGYIKANGALVNRADYPRLVKLATDNNLWTNDFVNFPGLFGIGDGNLTMQIPDWRGMFKRFLDDGKGYDVNRVLGSYQGDMTGPHIHTLLGSLGGQTADSQPVLHEMPVDIRLVDEQGQFIGLGAVSLNGRLQPKKLIQL